MSPVIERALMLRTAKIASVFAAVVLAGSIAAPAIAAPHDSTFFLKRTSRQTIDLGATGTSVGDMAFANGIVSKQRGGAEVGTYNFRGITVAVPIPGGRENRDALTQYNFKNGTLLMERINSVPAGTLPDSTEVYPIIGGSGVYAGAKGTVVFSVLSETEYKADFHFTR